ncbi:hypothetical protein EIK76_07140 [Rheinheimera mesophila]|uniref:Lipoprotein n=1 Tax=Rheinheimera mesophila TaxID=1547515 RepID=A0A3P3QRB6_9GAMM|nr:hypothetical protein [Rheinheimera mesophila]KKL01454.1 hypothetical protein SD53_10180 [Rheinheimera mesophila]RRJ23821.1 hypothetical protein EIK76_07140 [Rheinheimera mesophila]
MKHLALVIGLSGVLLSGCNMELLSADKAFNFDFNTGSHGWTAGFSDYPADNAEIYQLESGLRVLPGNAGKKAFYLSGMNRSDDLFMYIKNQFSGLEPSTKYYARVRLTFLSNAGVGCAGVGGAPGESVYLKFGYGDKEPKQEGYYLNLDKGQQSQSGTQAKVIGNVATTGAACDGSNFAEKTVQTTTSERVPVYSDGQGRVWVFIGTDSGYEGLTSLYYKNIEIALESL